MAYACHQNVYSHWKLNRETQQFERGFGWVSVFRTTAKGLYRDAINNPTTQQNEQHLPACHMCPRFPLDVQP